MTLRREATASSTDERRAPRHRSRGPGLGRVPFTVRVAVTGHRHLRRPDVVGAGVDAALDLIRTLFPARADTPVVLTAVSSLAEGADRVVAERVLATTGGGLEVALPLPADDYRSDFDSAWSDAEFEELVERASLVVEGAASGDREEGYERAGQYVVDRGDVLVAVWDGEPSRGRGGTAETIAYALNRRVPVVVVHSDDGSVSLDDGRGRPGQVFRSCQVERAELGAATRLPVDDVRAAFAHLEEYNTAELGIRGLQPRTFAAEVAKEDAGLPADVPTGDDLDLHQLGEWILPYFVRADRLALAYQRLYLLLIRVEFIAAATAVLTVAWLTQFEPAHPGLAVIELTSLLTVLFVVAFGRRGRFHTRWLSSRFLAERLRSAVFLKAAGLGARREGGFEGVEMGRRSEEWLRRAYTYVWNACPTSEPSEAHVDSLRSFLVRFWIHPQVRYHEGKSHAAKRSYRVLTAVSTALFLVTGLAAILHTEQVWPGTEHYQVLLSIALPAFGSAIAGIGAHRQYQRNAVVYERMQHYLTSAETRMSRARTLPEVQRAAAEVDDIMGDENRDWLGIMKFHDFEIAG